MELVQIELGESGTTEASRWHICQCFRVLGVRIYCTEMQREFHTPSLGLVSNLTARLLVKLKGYWPLVCHQPEVFVNQEMV